MVLSYLSNLNLEERERFFQQLDHELRGPLRKINTFCGIICEDERERLPSEQLVPLRKLASYSANLSEKLRAIAQAEDREELQVLFSELRAAINQLNYGFSGITTLTHADSPDNYQRIELLRRRVVYTYRTLFGLGETEHFSFRAYLQLYPFLNREVLAKKGVSFTNDIENFPFETETKEYEIVLENLLGNALTYGFPEGSISEGDRKVSLITRGNYLPYLVRVVDSGVGIDTERIAQQAVRKSLISETELKSPLSGLKQTISQMGLFVPEQLYVGLEESDRKDFLLNQLVFLPGLTTSAEGKEAVHGTSQGIGLSLVKLLVEVNGGEVWVRSKPGDTRFYFTIPLEKIVNYRR